MSDELVRPFYRDGLKFSCTRCNLCCRFESGYVWLSYADVSRLSERLDLSRDQVIERYCRVVDIGGFKQLSLQEQENKDCVFWRDGGCSVYDARPLQCRSFPFWHHELFDRETWDRCGESCPGINIGEVHSREEIDRWIEQRRLEPPMNADSIRR